MLELQKPYRTYNLAKFKSASTNELSEEYAVLKKRLISGELDPDSFRKILIQADQNTNDRAASEDNYLLLKDPEIKIYLTNSEFEDGYYILLSFTAFHCAQRIAIKGEDLDLAKKLFVEALSLKQKVSFYSEEDLAYLKATIAYLSGSVESVERLKLKINPDGPMKVNIGVLDRLIDGLRKYSKPNYRRDYFGIQENIDATLTN